MKSLLGRMLFALALPLGVISAQADSLGAPLQSLQERVSRLEGANEQLSSQLGVERQIAERTIDGVKVVVTGGLWFLGAAVALFGFIGYRNLRESVEQSLKKDIDIAVQQRIDAVASSSFEEQYRNWDKRFHELAARAERLLDLRKP